MPRSSAYVDTFAADNLPAPEQLPDLINLEQLGYPESLNAAVALLDDAVAKGYGDQPCMIAADCQFSYAELLSTANQIAHTLVDDLGLQSGERVLLQAPNHPLMVACWFAILKAGGIAVSTMPLLRSKELAVIAEKARIKLALCDQRLLSELTPLKQLQRIVSFNGGELEDLQARHSVQFDNVDTAAEDVALIAFTSGTTGIPKATMHFHRDLLTICDTFSRQLLKPDRNDIFLGSPPLAFTFGLGGQVLFPMRAGASTVLLEQANPTALAEAITKYRPTILFTSPTAYRILTELADQMDFTSLKKGVSAGETLPKAIYDGWQAKTGIRLIDGLGSTEMLHIFITAVEHDIRPGATGKPIPCYEAKIIDNDGKTLPPGTVGRLAVRGPTGCRYLADQRQQNYVVDGWNVTGDAYLMDEDGYFWFQSRTDDMIISSGYNIAGPEVEDTLLTHPAVAECAVVAAPDMQRGHIVKAFVVVREGYAADQELITALQDHVKQTIAPYKYPRAVEFVKQLPKTETGKIQRFRLRENPGA